MNYQERNGIVQPNAAYATADNYGKSQVYTPIVPPVLSTITPAIFRVAKPHTLNDKQISVDISSNPYIKLGQYCSSGY